LSLREARSARRIRGVRRPRTRGDTPSNRRRSARGSTPRSIASSTSSRVRAGGRSRSAASRSGAAWVENVDGWRAEYAYPYELVVRRGDEATLAALRRAYLVDVALD